MEAMRKLLLIFIACIAIQEISAWPPFLLSWQNSEYELQDKVSDYERDTRKELDETRYKIMKEGGKIVKKAWGIPNVQACVFQMQDNFLKALDTRSENAMMCFQKLLEDNGSGSDEGSRDWMETWMMRDSLKRRAKACRNAAKNEFEALKDEFVHMAKNCLY